MKNVYLRLIRSRPTAQSKVTIQHNHLNRKNIIQNQKYKCKNTNTLIYLTFIHCKCKFEKHKQSFRSENHEHTFPNKKHKQSNAHEKHTLPFPGENYNRTHHAHARATSVDSIPPRSLLHLCLLQHSDFVDKNCLQQRSFLVAYPTVLVF